MKQPMTFSIKKAAPLPVGLHAVVRALDWNHPKYYPVECPKCGWLGMSDDTKGGDAMADTGDYTDIVCPKCFDKQEWIPVNDAQRPNAKSSHSEL